LKTNHLATLRPMRRCRTVRHTKIRLILFLPYNITCHTARIHYIFVGLCK
jgi:hypothetical protein